MSLETKLTEGMKRHHAKMKEHEKKHGKEETGEGKHHHVEIKKLEKGYLVRAHHKEKHGEYREPIESAHKTHHEAFRHAKSLMVPAGENSDEGEMKE